MIVSKHSDRFEATFKLKPKPKYSKFLERRVLLRQGTHESKQTVEVPDQKGYFPWKFPWK
jgi:hypothetical protein